MLTPKDVQKLARRLDNEIKKIDDELSNISLIDESITKDLESLISTYSDEIKKSNIDVQDIRKKYRLTLRNKKIEALLQAKEKLKALRTELSMVMSDNLAQC